ncbi:amino acid adenylation domain-containing protein, partial [Staphylococcus caprae]|uniref:amino acid adenylation domain-containing protein n=1 Tax=Staphylococcus caprae TaxID=29380 RepID=UPI003B2156B1
MIDGVSWRILYEDLINSINNYLAGEPIQLPMKTTSFKEYSEKLKQYQKANIDQDIKAYWLNIIDELEADNFKGETKVKQEDEIIFNEEETEYITEVLPQQFKATIEEILLAAFLLEINNHTEKTKVWITMEGHGREDFDETVDINRTVGWFTTMYPVGFELKNDFVEMLKEVKLRLRAVPRKGFEYGLVKNGNSEIIEPDISFNFLGKFKTNDKGIISKNKFGNQDFNINNIYKNRNKIEFTAIKDYNLKLHFNTEIYNININNFRKIFNKNHTNRTKEVMLLRDYSSEKLEEHELNDINDKYKKIEDIYDMTPMQRNLYDQYLLEDNTSNLVSLYFELKDYDYEKLIKSVTKTFEDNDIFKTKFTIVNEKYFGVKTKHANELKILYKNLNEKDFENLINKKEYIDIEYKGTFIVYIVKVHDKNYILFKYHHIYLDGTSILRFVEDISKEYYNEHNKKSVSIIDYNKKYYKNEKEIGEFWEFYLSNIKSTMCISTNNKKKNMKSHLFKLNDSDVNNISSKTKVTTNNIYQFLYGLTLSNLLDRKQVIFGVTVFNNEQQSIGLGLNNIPIIMNFENLNTRVENLISKVSKDFSAIFNHSLVDIDSIKNNNKKLYDYHYVFENYNQNFNSSLFDINNITGVESPEFNFGISVSPKGYVKVIYNEIFFSKKFIKEFVNEFKKMTHKVNVNLDNEFKEIFDMETTTTKNKITNNFKDYFDKYVRKNTRTAYIYNSKPYSYEDLKSNVEKASSFIREHNYRNIGVLSKNDLHHSIIMISTFYSGATLIPINSNFSEKVINEIIKESEIDLLITDQFLTSKVTQIPFKKIFNNKNTKCTKYFNNNIAYIIYTSGTTGKPKGVKVTYTNLINKLQSIQNIYSTTSEETILKNISPFFDPSIIETINPFMNGAKILFQGENKLMGEELLKFINKNQITTITLTPSILNTFEPKPNMDLQKIYCGGEKLDIKNIERWKDTNCKIFNLYGPTETTVTTHVFLVPKNFKGQNLPIGSSLEDVYDLILNENMTPTIDGFEGELYIGGTGVAAGYLNQPNLTRDSFIQNPYNKQKDIIYKTGDIVKRLPNGELQFIGRKDKQVKIRGFRIELDGIKQEALKIDNVDDIVVTTDEDHQTKKLYLFYKGKANEQYIRHYLRQVLPDYMIPHFIVKVDTFPLTVNGKIDEKQLLNQNEFNSIYIEESNNEYKSIIASIFKDILNSSSVSNDKDFFELGGDSLMITRLANRLNETFNQQLSIKDLFNTSSIDGIYHLLMNRKENVELPIIPAENKKRGRLSFSQERLWFLYKTHGAKSNYNMTSFEEINNTIDIQRLREAYNQLGNYHNSLKINFKEINGTPYQFISEKELYIQVKQVNTLTEIEKIIHDETNYKFDLEKDSLTRLTLIKADGKNYLLLVQHHIISDGWSLDNFFQDLWAFYDKQLQLKLEINYIDYAEWQQQLIENHMYDDQLKFWANYLKNKELVSNLSYDFDKPKVLKYEGQSIIRKTQIKQRDINNLAQSLGVSPFILAYSLFQAFMCKYNNLPEITIGTPVSNRTHPQVERLIGFFVNNVAVNIEFENINFKDFIKKNKKNILNVFDHQEVPFDKVVDHLNVSRELNTSPIFQVMFTYENREGNSEWEKTLSQINEGTKYEISAILKPVNGNLEFMFEYSSELFKSTTIERMMLSFEYWVNQFIENPKLNLQEAKLFKANDTKELSVNSGIELKIVDTAIDLYYQNFEEHRLGVRDSNLEYTYRQIEDLSNIVSRNLNNHFMTKQNIVGVSVERNANLIPLILGILKSGNIYLPIDPSLPKQRKEFIIQDSQVDLLITGEPTEFENVSSILINEILLSNVKPLPEVSTKAELNDVAYIIYTSGTTGTPKGVKVTHLNLSNLIQWEMDKYHINQTIISQYASISFDASIWEILPALASNSTIIILEEKIKTDMEQLIPFINENGIEVLHLPSSLSEWVMEHPLHSVKYVLVGGEKLNINKKALKYPLYDHYGPTEGTVLVTSTEKSLNESCNQGIGTPITNVQTYILDDNKQLLPIGVKGELYIGGVSVSEGYLNREELTRERFIINPYKKEEVLYKTGDIVRQRDDNTIEYISRTDNQVQIRGYRIEIGEIEAIAKKIGKLDEVVVIVDGENNKQLVLYYSGTIEENELKQRLKEYLPNYMIPSFFVKLVVLPRNTNEKIDYSQLPKPKKTNKRKQIIKTEDQKLLLKIWEEVLNVSNISIDDNFFEIGGDSISTIQVVSKCKESGIHLTTKDIFSYQTVRELAEVVKKTQKLNINQDMVKGELPVTPIQSWFFDQEYPVINHWNQSMAWEIHKDIPEKEMHHIIEK